MRRTLQRLALAALWLTPSAALAQDVVKIGFHAPLTGFAAADGKSARQGAELAVQQANAAGGINGKKIELVVYDDEGKPENTIPLANKLTGQDKVAVVVSGGYSGPTRAAAPVMQRAGVPYLSAYAIHPDITRAGDFIFRTGMMGEVQGRAGAKLVGELLKKKKVVIVAVNNDFGQALTAGFKEVAPKFGIEVLKEHTFAMPDRQFGPLVAQVKASAPEVIYAPGYFFNAGPLVAQLRAAGVDATIIGQEGYDSQRFIEIAGKASEGVIVTTSLDRDSSAPATRSFIENYEKTFKDRVDMVAASGNAAATVAIEALRKAGSTDPKAIRDTIRAGTFETAIGTLSFNSLGEVKKAVQVQVVKDGNFHRYAVIDDLGFLAPPEK
ncbi:ABC transporter substrate-binding protein [Rhodoplanes serenus]|uniref:ABC transporter substrate-binding protein n=1 Tax=Rhodoplanes serenus TaxID=200615 RepID=A0A9X5ATT8_9BRAD|nr:ABC transporter substrate-binding protein [Rhodoplanes serenus]MTW17600.1 ABC transporter substrate-binding protein [Rhodoplanes serenus]